MPTTKRAQKKLAVITDFGQYTWLRMPMGAKNCPAVFQRMMDSAFRSMPLSSLVIYLDDILLHSQTLEEHLVKLKEMFITLRKTVFTYAPIKPSLHARKSNFAAFALEMV